MQITFEETTNFIEFNDVLSYTKSTETLTLENVNEVFLIHEIKELCIQNYLENYSENFLPRETYFEHLSIKKLNNEAKEQLSELEVKLLSDHEKNLQYNNVILRCMWSLYYYYMCVIGYTLPPLCVNNQILFVTTPSVYALKNYHTVLTNKQCAGTGGFLLFCYAWRCAMFEKLNFSSPLRLRNYFKSQISFHAFLLKNMGIGGKLVRVAREVGKKIAKHLKWV